jgi:hypothetical protein
MGTMAFCLAFAHKVGKLQLWVRSMTAPTVQARSLSPIVIPGVFVHWGRIEWWRFRRLPVDRWLTVNEVIHNDDVNASPIRNS